MFDWIRWWVWKRKARRAVRESLTAACCHCNDHIFPGDFVGVGINETKEKILVHAGYHNSLKEKYVICESGGIGVGFWDGKEVAGIGESLASKALRTGRPQIRQ